MLFLNEHLILLQFRYGNISVQWKDYTLLGTEDTVTQLREENEIYMFFLKIICGEKESKQ